EVAAQIVQKVGKRSRVEMLRPVRLVARLDLHLFERRLQIADAALALHLRALVPVLQRLESPPQVGDHLAPGLGERERLFPGLRSLSAPTEVEVEEDTRDAREGRQSGDDRGDDGGHPAQARGLIPSAQSQGRAGPVSPDVGAPDARSAYAHSRAAVLLTPPSIRTAADRKLPANRT